MAQFEPILLDSTGQQIVKGLENIANALGGGGGSAIGKTLNETSWETIDSLIKKGEFADHFKIGDEKWMTINDAEHGISFLVSVVVAGIDTYEEGTVDFVLSRPCEFLAPYIWDSTGSRYDSKFGWGEPNYSYSGYYTGDKLPYSAGIFYHSGEGIDYSDYTRWAPDDTMGIWISELSEYNNTKMITMLPEELQASIVPKTLDYIGFKLNKNDEGAPTSAEFIHRECTNKIWTPTYFEIMNDDPTYISNSSGSTNYIKCICESSYQRNYAGIKDFIHFPINQYYAFASVFTAQMTDDAKIDDTHYEYKEGDILSYMTNGYAYMAHIYRYPSQSRSTQDGGYWTWQTHSIGQNTFPFNYFGFRLGK